ncbi:MAG: hypothetical protein Q8Q50_04780 [Methylobacter sp.]|nr:hypothetical protein [Methylobacter sp.]
MPYSTLPPLQALNLTELKAIARDFVAPRSLYSLPRAAFFGRFNYLSMTDQRHIAKQLGFEYIEDIVFGTTSDEQIAKLTSKWREVTDYTRLVVIGEAYDDSIFEDLYRRYKPKKDGGLREPIIIENSVPVMMESELIKIHPDYPNISLSTSWKGLVL